MLISSLATAAGIFLATAIGLPLLEQYDKWKASDREIIARRNWRGQWIPDLGIIRIERAVKTFLLLFFATGLLFLWVIMTSGQY